MNRRQMIKGSLAAGGLSILGIPDWAIPALAQGETLVRFTDLPEVFQTTLGQTRTLDIRKIDGLLTPKDQFYTLQHFDQPTIDAATFRLKVTGLVARPREFSIDELRRLGDAQIVAGFECSGNSGRRMHGLASNGRWTGVPLRKVLGEAAIGPEGREVVFFGADHGEEDVDFRGQVFKVDQQFGRSLSREEALGPDPFLAYALNGDPLTREQGSPLRLVVPGWYGVANVKWLAQIHVQADRYLGKYQARWYRTLVGETIDGEVKWKERAVTRMQLKSVIARVTRDAGQHTVLGFALNDGTPLRRVEVKIDEGPWQAATFDPANTRFSWKLFRYGWKDATPGEHTLVSRVIDARGAVQPEGAELESKKTFLEDNRQFPRKVMIG
jgi:DMSO/TMAO reductase YedYZ molybdopterin-dependent catalytic subunit